MLNVGNLLIDIVIIGKKFGSLFVWFEVWYVCELGDDDGFY